MNGWSKGAFIMYVLTHSLLWSPFSSLNVGNLFIALSFQSETNIEKGTVDGTFPLQVDSWEMKCCLFIDSPIYSHLCQLISRSCHSQKTHYKFTLSLQMLFTQSSPSSHWDVIYISAIRSNFSSHDYFHLQGIQCLYGSSMESKWQRFLNAVQNK